MAKETVADLANKAISQRDQAREHPLEMAAESIAADDSVAPEAQSDTSWEHLPVEQRSSATENVDVSLDTCISVVHGGPREWRRYRATWPDRKSVVSPYR